MMANFHERPMTYKKLVARYGHDMAFDLLVTIESLAKIKHDIIEINEEIRLQRALEVLDEAEFGQADKGGVK